MADARTNFAIGNLHASAIGRGKGNDLPLLRVGEGKPRLAPRLGPRVRERIFRRTLGAVAGLIPEAGDVAGHAAGKLSVAEIAVACGLSRSDARRSLAFLRRWRVLWLRYRGAGIIEIRFDRRLAKGFVLAAAVVPAELPKFLAGHRAKREAVAPWSSKGGVGLDSSEKITQEVYGNEGF